MTKAIALRLAALAVTALALYGVTPALIEVFGSLDEVGQIRPGWWVVVVVVQALGIGCLCALQRQAIGMRRWWPVVSSQLTGAALGRVIPGGAATAGATQLRMLSRAGASVATAATGIAASSILLLIALAGMPLAVTPAVITGLDVPDDLARTALLGLGLFVALGAAGAVMLISDRAVERIGRAVRWSFRRLHLAASDDLPRRLRTQIDLVRGTLGDRWPRALAAASGRWIFDYLTLLAALAAVDARPSIALTLLAYCAAQLLAQIPITPGGLGIVEAGLTSALALAGVAAASAAAATLAYRLASYWLPLLAGLVAWLLYRRRITRRG